MVGVKSRETPTNGTNWPIKHNYSIAAQNFCKVVTQPHSLMTYKTRMTS